MPLKAKSHTRVTRVERIGMQIRAELRKEDLGILAYMRRNGLEKAENYNNCDATIQEFRELSSGHPQLVPKQEAVVEL